MWLFEPYKTNEVVSQNAVLKEILEDFLKIKILYKDSKTFHHG